MSINLIRFLDNQRRRAERYRVDTLRYRGVEYKKWSGDFGGGSIPPFTYLALAPAGIPFAEPVW